MNVGKTLFAQVMEFVPWTSFSRIVTRYGGDAGVRRLTCTEQFRAMAFTQLTWRESLRDIEVTLGANATKQVYFSVQDCAQEASRVGASGGKLIRPKFSIGEFGWVALCEDTEENLFGLSSMK